MGGKIRGGAVKYEKLSPVVDGVRMRWQEGRLVPRGEPQALPLTQRQAARRRKSHPQPKRVPRAPATPHGTYRRNDLKGAMRAARRAGLISARQQRKYHRGARPRA